MNVSFPVNAAPVASSPDREFIDHGGRLNAARKRYPNAPEPWIDLSTGICPWAYPIPPLSVECWSRLPDPVDLGRLIAAARSAYRAPETADVYAICGTDPVINLLPRLLAPAGEVAIVSPTYMPHEKAWTAAGHRVRRVGHPDEIAASPFGIIVNPNNPDGRQWPAALLHKTAREMAGHNGLLIVDEAFADVAASVSMLNPDANLANVLVLRSFGKFYGLAGVRLGFMVTGHPIGALLAKLASDWPVSGPAIEIGRAALGDTSWAHTNIQRLETAASRLDRTLADAGLEILGGTSLFRLARHADANALFDRLAQNGILVRALQDGHMLRFGILPNDAAFTRLSAALTR